MAVSFTKSPITLPLADIEISSSLHFYYGRCYTLKPLSRTKGAWKDYGYSILLKHDGTGLSNNYLPGWHLFIHEPSEPFSGTSVGEVCKKTICCNIVVILLENRFQTSGRVEHMFIEVYEEVELKLSALNYIMMPNVDSKCTEDPDKSISKVNIYFHNLITAIRW